jgi:hypothetical protein
MGGEWAKSGSAVGDLRESRCWIGFKGVKVLTRDLNPRQKGLGVVFFHVVTLHKVPGAHLFRVRVWGLGFGV